MQTPRKIIAHKNHNFQNTVIGLHRNELKNELNQNKFLLYSSNIKLNYKLKIYVEFKH